MKIWKKVGQPAPPTATDNVEKVYSGDGVEKNRPSLDIKGGVQEPHHANPQLEKRVIRKLDFRVVPLLSALYLLAFLDRSNIGNARIAGMEEALELRGNRYQWLLNIFYISYIVFEFQALMWKIVPPNIWAAFVVFGWGLAATLQATARSWATEMVCRFFLGLFEAGFGPGIPYLLSFFYLRHELGLRIGIFLSAAPLATTFAGALAYGITSGHSKMANWRLLFLVEGLPTIIMAPIVYRFLPVSPEKARFLDSEEALVAKARGVRQVGDQIRVGGIVWSDIGATLADAKAWFTATVGVRYFGVFLAAAGIFPTIANILPWVLSEQFSLPIIARPIDPISLQDNQGSDTRRGTGIVILQFIGQCGPLLGTNVFPKQEGPRYTKGMWVSAAFTLFTAFLALGLRALLVWENKKLDKKYGPRPELIPENGIDPAAIKTAVGEENYGPNFRYVL
ncbi:MAG: hypothetical protein Q9186_005178 [Xanthomendoza sp. 1 TL-2023]